MEYRKLISFGKSSFVVSLPLGWIRQNKLKKGDLIYFDEGGNNLILQPKPAEPEEEGKEIKINVDGKDFKRIQREIISAYIQNSKNIILQGNEIKEKAKDIQKFLQNLVALEVMEQDSKKMVAKDFLDIKDISTEQIVRKMDVITKSMIKDCKKMFEEDNYESIYHRDYDVNKFRFLIYRIVWFGQEKPSAILKKLSLTQRNLLTLWWLSFNIEAIADSAKRIARHMREIKLSSNGKNEFLQLLGEAEAGYNEVMKGYYTQNIEIAHKVLQDRVKIISLCDDFHFRNRNIPSLGYLIYNLKSLITSSHTIGRIIYQGVPG